MKKPRETKVKLTAGKLSVGNIARGKLKKPAVKIKKTQTVIAAAGQENHIQPDDVKARGRKTITANDAPAKQTHTRQSKYFRQDEVLWGKYNFSRGERVSDEARAMRDETSYEFNPPNGKRKPSKYYGYRRRQPTHEELWGYLDSQYGLAEDFREHKEPDIRKKLLYYARLYYRKGKGISMPQMKSMMQKELKEMFKQYILKSEYISRHPERESKRAEDTGGVTFYDTGQMVKTMNFNIEMEEDAPMPTPVSNTPDMVSSNIARSRRLFLGMKPLPNMDSKEAMGSFLDLIEKAAKKKAKIASALYDNYLDWKLKTSISLGKSRRSEAKLYQSEDELDGDEIVAYADDTETGGEELVKQELEKADKLVKRKPRKLKANMRVTKQPTTRQLKSARKNSVSRFIGLE